MAYVVNGERIEDSVIEEEFESIKDHYESIGESVCCDRDQEIWDMAHANVVNRAVLEQESISRYGDVDDAAVEARFDELVAEHGGEQSFYDNTGFNPGDAQVIRKKLKSGLIIDRLLEEEVTGFDEVTEESLEAFYQENIERYMSQEEVRVSQIFIEPASHDGAREAYVALRDVRKELIEGKDFDDAAKEHGSDSKQDIDLGFMKQGETMPEVEAITFSMEIGEISPVIATHYGFHIFKVTDRKEPKPVPRAEIEGLAETMKAENRAKAVDDYIGQLKERGSIEEVASEETA
ncbi:MAG: peptidyl-prolyl cis-trans isomerase [Verrucomicrobiota bacterium]